MQVWPRVVVKGLLLHGVLPARSVHHELCLKLRDSHLSCCELRRSFSHASSLRGGSADLLCSS